MLNPDLQKSIRILHHLSTKYQLRTSSLPPLCCRKYSTILCWKQLVPLLMSLMLSPSSTPPHSLTHALHSLHFPSNRDSSLAQPAVFQAARACWFFAYKHRLSTHLNHGVLWKCYQSLGPVLRAQESMDSLPGRVSCLAEETLGGMGWIRPGSLWFARQGIFNSLRRGQ